MDVDVMKQPKQFDDVKQSEKITNKQKLIEKGY
jgi:hypothetical protein